MLAKCCVFSKQSYLTFMCQPSNYTTAWYNSIATLSFEITELFCLVPSGEFSQHLSIFYLPTCVGLEYGIFYIIFSCINKKNKSIYRASPRRGMHRAEDRSLKLLWTLKSLINLLSIKCIYNKFLINQSFRLYS